MGQQMPTLRLPGLEALDRPRLGPASIRQLAKLMTTLHWPAIVFGGVLGIVIPPRLPIALALLLVWVAVYNAWGVLVIPRASDKDILRIGRALILLDIVSFFSLIAVFGGVGGISSVYTSYLLLMVWMVAYDGAEGAFLAVALFVIGMIALQAVLATFFGVPFNGRDVLLWSLIMAVGGAILAAFDRIMLTGVIPAELAAPPNGTSVRAGPAAPATGAPPGDPGVRLTAREQEVLRLVSQGYSNSMIANRLHLSENTVKTYVESLLSRLNARNRAEAVATASRQNLI
jgi:DNA-binding CsgD family transcriptional regulator